MTAGWYHWTGHWPSQFCLPRHQLQQGRKFIHNSGKKNNKKNYCVDSWTLEQVAQRLWSFYSSIYWNLPGHASEQPAVAGHALSRLGRGNLQRCDTLVLWICELFCTQHINRPQLCWILYCIQWQQKVLFSIFPIYYC